MPIWGGETLACHEGGETEVTTCWHVSTTLHYAKSWKVQYSVLLVPSCCPLHALDPTLQADTVHTCYLQWPKSTTDFMRM